MKYTVYLFCGAVGFFLLSSNVHARQADRSPAVDAPAVVDAVPQRADEVDSALAASLHSPPANCNEEALAHKTALQQQSVDALRSQRLAAAVQLSKEVAGIEKLMASVATNIERDAWKEMLKDIEKELSGPEMMEEKDPGKIAAATSKLSGLAKKISAFKLQLLLLPTPTSFGGHVGPKILGGGGSPSDDSAPTKKRIRDIIYHDCPDRNCD